MKLLTLAKILGIIILGYCWYINSTSQQHKFITQLDQQKAKFDGAWADLKAINPVAAIECNNAVVSMIDLGLARAGQWVLQYCMLLLGAYASCCVLDQVHEYFKKKTQDPESPS